MLLYIIWSTTNIESKGFILGYDRDLTGAKELYKTKTGMSHHKNIFISDGFHLIDQEGRINSKSGITAINIPAYLLKDETIKIYFFYEKSWSSAPQKDNLIIHYRFDESKLTECIQSLFCGLDSPHTHYLTGSELASFIKGTGKTSIGSYVPCMSCGESGPLKIKCKNSMVSKLLEHRQASWHICDVHYNLRLHNLVI